MFLKILYSKLYYNFTREQIFCIDINILMLIKNMNKYNSNKNYSKKYLWWKIFYRNVFFTQKFLFIYIYKYMCIIIYIIIIININIYYYYYYYYLYIIIIKLYIIILYYIKLYLIILYISELMTFLGHTFQF